MQINGSGNVYEQIVSYYQKYISLGILKPGEKMPSCRELAVEIGVNHKTVERAYSELEKEGLIQAVPKKGFFICGNEKKNPMLTEVIRKLRDDGITREEIENAIDEVFGKESL